MVRSLVRVLASVALPAALFVAPVAASAQGNSFDLAGPDVSVTVHRGGRSLPLPQVPSLQPGDRLVARALLPADQSAHYVLMVAFLRGATNPPPKDWFYAVESWRRKKNVLDIAVPQGARQAVLLLAPQAGGGFDAVRDAVRGRPGIFVRAAQDLYQASLDRARLDTFVDAIGRIRDADPERLGKAAPVLANMLRIKFNADCLARPRDQQAECLTQNRDDLVLNAQRGATLTDTLTGAPVDLAYQVAATPEGGAGYYSPYIGLVRDVAKLFGAFRSAQYQYLPTLALGRGEATHLLLNSAPSFQNPRSVLVVPMPPIGAAPAPLWRAGSAAPVCLARPDLVMPIDDASLLFATRYARDLRLHLVGDGGRTADLPVVPDAEGGGIRLAPGTALPVSGPIRQAVLQGEWGFDPFTGPRLPVQYGGDGTWTPRPDAAVVVGREQPLVLTGESSACVSQATLRLADGETRPVPWKAVAPDRAEAQLPLAGAKPGTLSLAITRFGTTAPDTITLTARAEASRLDRFSIHQGDRAGVLDGARLDQVASLELGGRHFVATTLTRGDRGDRLDLVADGVPAATDARTALVRLRDGRSASVAAIIAPARPAATIVHRAVTAPAQPATLPIVLPDGVMPVDGTLAVSLRLAAGTSAEDAIEVASDDAAATLTAASGSIQRVGDDIAVARFVPRSLLGATASGALRYRVRRGDATGDWQPLVQTVRLPVLTGLSCPDSTGECTLAGRDLFLVTAVGDTPDLAKAVVLPPGFVGSSVAVPRPAGHALYIRLADAPGAIATVSLP